MVFSACKVALQKFYPSTLVHHLLGDGEAPVLEARTLAGYYASQIPLRHQSHPSNETVPTLQSCSPPDDRPVPRSFSDAGHCSLHRILPTTLTSTCTPLFIAVIPSGRRDVPLKLGFCRETFYSLSLSRRTRGLRGNADFSLPAVSKLSQ